MHRTARFTLTALALAASAVSAAQVRNPGTVVRVAPGDWASFDPAYCVDIYCNEALTNLLEPLVTFDTSGKDRLVPVLAANVPTVANGGISKNGRTYRVKLRPDARFSDGSDVTAEDVAYSVQRVLVYSPSGGAAADLLDPLLGRGDLVTTKDAGAIDRITRAVVAVDQDTVEFRLAKPFAPFVKLLANIMVYSKADAVRQGDWDGRSATWTKFNNRPLAASPYRNRAPLGSAPFVLEKYEPGRLVVLKRNDRYWRAKAKLDRVILQRVDDPTTRLQMLKAGDADIAVIAREQFGSLKGNRDVTIVDDLPSLGVVALLFNLDVQGGTDVLGSGKLDGKGIPADFFADVDVRKGFSHLFDTPTFVQGVLLGKGTVSGSLIPGVRIPPPTFDPKLASTYLKRAYGGQLWANGFTITAYYPIGYPHYGRAMDMLKRNLAAINPKFKLDVREALVSKLLSDLGSRRHPLLLLGNGAAYADPHPQLFTFLSSRGPLGAAMGVGSPDIDRLLDQGLAAVDDTERARIYTRLEQLAAQRAFVVPQFWGVNFMVHRSWLKGRQFNHTHRGFSYYPMSK